jgi:tetratricopeptide (TPR) repeat protein
MPQGNDAKPGKDAVLRQLERMLAHPHFAARPQQARLFEFLVRSDLGGQEITEKDIRAEFFPTPPYSPESTIARTTVNFIRGGLVREYYAQEGKDDPVIIALPAPSKSKTPAGRSVKLPPGKAYKPTFSYNPRHEIARRYQLGLQYLRVHRRDDVGDVLRELLAVIEMEPGHTAAHIALAETLCMSALTGYTTKDFMVVAHDSASDAAALSPDDWNAQAVHATTLFLNGDMPRAADAFMRASRCEGSEVRGYVWFHAFLMVTDRTEQALMLSRKHADENPDSAPARAIYAGFLYLARRFDEAKEALLHVLELDLGCWPASMLMALLEVSYGDYEAVYRHLNMMQRALYLPLEIWFLPGVSLFCYSKSPTMTAKGLAAAQTRAEQLAHYFSPPLWLQAALCAMVKQDADGAIEALAKARDELDPMMRFIHLLPLFDPLRTHPGFAALEDRPTENMP